MKSKAERVGIGEDREMETSFTASFKLQCFIWEEYTYEIVSINIMYWLCTPETSLQRQKQTERKSNLKVMKR